MITHLVVMLVTLGVFFCGWWARGQTNYRREMEAQGVPVEAPRVAEEEVNENIGLDQEA